MKKFPGIDGELTLPTNWDEFERYTRAVSFLGWPEQRAVGHLVKWHDAPKDVGTASAFTAMDAQSAKNAVDDLESRAEIVQKIMRCRDEFDSNFYAQAGKDVGELIKLVNSLSKPDDVMELWMEVMAKAGELGRATLR